MRANNTSTTFTSSGNISILNSGNTTFNVAPLNSASGQTLTLSGGLNFASNATNQINITGSSNYTLALGNLVTQSTTGGPYTLAVNATTAAATISSITEGSYGTIAVFTGSNNVSAGVLNLNSNGNDGLTVNGPTVTYGGGSDPSVVGPTATIPSP